MNLMRKEEENSVGKLPWLEDTDERKYMTDREILDKYVNLDNSCLTKVEKTQVRDVLYKYKDAFNPVMLISRKMTQDKRVVLDFRHLNMHIAKNNLAYPLLKDTFSVLGSSKCEVMSVLNLKDAFHSLQLTENLKNFLLFVM